MTFSQIAFWAASTIATSVVTNLVNTAYSKLSERILPADSIDELERLKTALSQITAVMRIAEALKMKDPNTSEWVEQFRQAVEASEDVLDELEYKTLEDMVKNQDEAGGSTSSSKKRKVSALNDDMLERLKKALTMLDQAVAGVDHLVKLAENLGISNLSESRQDAGKDLGRETTSFNNEKVVIGRSVEKDMIIGWLKQPSCAGLSSFGIVGVGGVGKTTLVQFAYKQMRGSNHFDKTIWVCVSTNFSVVDITRKILGELGEGSCSGKPLNALQETLKENIQLKKILLILDDIWDDERRGDWEQLVAPLGFAQKGSKILFTTRMKSVANLLASVINTEHDSLTLEGLEEQDLQSLFYSHAFRHFDCRSNGRLKIFGDQIVKMLRGNPLAAKVIGGLLNSSMEDQHWRRIVNYSSIFNIEGAKNVVEVLKLSYYHLPANLQVCFRFCSIFPQDHEFDKNNLIKMWIASGFIQQELYPENRPEDIGEDHFNHLLRKSFFEYSESCKDERYVMHDLMYELALNVSNGECCRIEPGDKSITIPSTVRHVSVDESEIEWVSHLENLRSLVITTSFGFTNDESDLFVLPKNIIKKSLRLLKIYMLRNCELPNEISCLVHLRYLSIDGFHSLKFKCANLDSVYKLYQLQVLEFPQLDNKIEEDGYTTGLTHLNRLRYIRLPNNMMQGIHKLTSLQELTFSVEQKNGYHINEINTLNNLRHLSIENIENIENLDEAKSANLLGKNNIISLSLKWTHDSNPNNSEKIIDYLQPHPNLMELTIMNYKGQRSPSWMEESPHLNLSSLKLMSCPMWKKLFSVQIPYLKILNIYHCLNLENLPDMPLSLIEFRICNVGLTSLPRICNNTQPQESLKSLLRVVHIVNCPNLISLNGFLHQDNLDLQAIETLSINNCERLVHLPTHGFGNLTSLIELTLINCPKLVAMDFQCCPLPTELQKLNMGNSGELDLPLLRASSGVTTLTELELKNANINSITATQNSFRSLEKLYIWDCTMLVEISFPEKAHGENEYNLSLLDIRDCRNLTKLPSMPLSVTNFVISNVPLSALPRYCKSSDSRSSPSTSSLKPSLFRVFIINCPNLTSLNGFLQQDNIDLLSINKLFIKGCKKLVKDSRNQAHHINQGSNLVSLKLSNLSIDQLSLLLIEPLRSARSVSHLFVEHCSWMKAFPEQWLLQNCSSLEKIIIFNGARKRIREYLRAMKRSLTVLEMLEINEKVIFEADNYDL